MIKSNNFQPIFVIAVSLISLTTLNAQQNINPTLEVKRDFDAKLLEISKSKLHSNFADSLGIFDLSFKYSIFDKPIKDLYEFIPLNFAEIDKTSAVKQPLLQLSAGSNYPINPFVSLLLQPISSPRFSLVLHAEHNSFLGKLPGTVKSRPIIGRGVQPGMAPSSLTNANLGFKYTHKKGETGIEAEFKDGFNSYYGLDEFGVTSQSLQYYPDTRSYKFMKDSLSHNLLKGGVRLYAKSLNSKNNSFYYDLDFRYSALNAISKYYTINYSDSNPFPGLFKDSLFSENYINIGAAFGAGFLNFNKILVETRYEASNSYSTKTFDRSNVEIHPKYIYSKGRISADAGFKYHGWQEGATRGYNLYFSGSIKFTLIKERFWIYALLDGKNNFMNYDKISGLNPWIHTGIKINNIEQPVIARGGIKGKIKERVSFNIYAGYEEYRDQLYFYSNFTLPSSEALPANSFGALYNNEKRTLFGGELLLTTQDVSGGVNTQFTAFRDDNNMTNRHYNSAPFELRAFLRYNWRERIILYTNLHYRQKSPEYYLEDLLSSSVTPPIHTPSYALLNIESSYVYNKNITLFIRLNNILNSDIIQYGTYSMPKFNGGIGLTVKL